MRSLPKWTWQLIPILLCGVTWAITPVCTCGRGPAKRSACLSNLKQLGLGVLMYASDCDDKLPNRDSWMDEVEPYIKAPGVEHCPLTTGVGLYGYALNATARSIDDAPNPAEKELVYDSDNLSRNASDPGTSMPVQGRHEGKNNIAYLDGHVRSVRANAKSPPESQGEPGKRL